MSLKYDEQMSFTVYKSKSSTANELKESSLFLAKENIPNSKITMYFMKAEKQIQNENGEEDVEKGNIQIYHDAKRNIVFVERTSISDSTHELLFKEYEVHGELKIPGKKEATNKFVKKMLTLIRSYK